MSVSARPTELAVTSPQALCLWSDQSMGWDDADVEVVTDELDKDLREARARHWEYVGPARRPDTSRAHAFLRLVRIPLSAIHPGLKDVEIWTLNTRSTFLLILVLTVLVTFGAAIFA